MDVSSRASQELADDEEAALRFAALEKLPTNLRMRRGVLKEEEGQARETHVNNHGLIERKNLVKRITAEGNQYFLLKLKERFHRVGLAFPTIEVRFEHINVEAQVYAGGRAQPNVFNFIFNKLEDSLNYLHLVPSQKRPLTILNDVSGVIKPGRMTLLLGPPSSGKTSLLLALAGKLDQKLKVSGEITYNGHEMKEFIPLRTSAYVSQYDLHLAELTVRETLAFSARCQGIGARYEMLTELSRREKEAKIKPDPDLDNFMKAASVEGQETSVMTDYIIKILGLEECADTVVGDEMIRGISGGEKKRLTTGEMLVGPSRALFMDEISNGLDSSTTYEIVNSIKQSVHILQKTVIISLLQPSPETYNLFDDIILLSDGQIVYQGPREKVLEFFEHMGFKCPKKKGVADFLQEVTSMKDQEQYWIHRDEHSYQYVSNNDFSEAFQSSNDGQNLGNELSVPFDKEKSHPLALATVKYGVSKKELLKACVAREYLLMKRNLLLYILRMIQVILVAFISTTVFFRTKMHKNTIIDGGIYLGSTYHTLTMTLLNGLSDLIFSTLKLPVFYKHRDLLFFPPWAYSLPVWILKIPVTLAEISVWLCMTYYTTGYDSDAGRFHKQLLVLVCLHQVASGLFRLIGAIGRNIIIASTLASLVLLIIIVFGGFVISRGDINVWWIWCYWLSPLMYGQTSLAVNEFLGKSWSHTVIPGSRESVGMMLLKVRGFFSEVHWYWIGVGALIGYIFIFNLLYTLALTYLSPFGKSQANLSEETLEKRNAPRRGKPLELSSSTSQEQEFDVHMNSPSREHNTTQADINKKRGMILPFEPISIAFDDIHYSVDMPQEMKAHEFQEEDRLELLKGVSGVFRPGVLTAVMGITGAGKTTLMDVLANRKTRGYVHGKITISGYQQKQETFARKVGYCEQTDIHSPHVTVHESLVFSAWLRLPLQVDPATRKMFIEEVMELVELTPLKEALVGLPGVNGLSVEQRKRLTIAVELVSNPSIIFMDEPTSGLDARTAATVMRTSSLLFWAFSPMNKRSISYDLCVEMKSLA